MTIERRFMARMPEIRADVAGKTAAGYAALFGVDADIGGMFIERIAPGAFADALQSDVRALIDHDSGRVIGRTKSGTLRLSEDETGLAVEIDLPDTTDGRDIAEQMRRGDITGMSFGFRVTKEQWDDTGDIPARTILGVELYEVSIVAFPAYEDTEIALRSLAEARDERKRENFSAAARRLRMKTTLDLTSRSKAASKPTGPINR